MNNSNCLAVGAIILHEKAKIFIVAQTRVYSTGCSALASSTGMLNSTNDYKRPYGIACHIVVLSH
ncbi:MAG: hypothetical protein V1874_15605 [Spirochaetota bacterium]